MEPEQEKIKYNPYVDLNPPKGLIRNVIKQWKLNAYSLLEDIRILRGLEGAGGQWLIDQKQKQYKLILYKIRHAHMYLNDVDISQDFSVTVAQAKLHPIQDLFQGKLRKMGLRLKGQCPFHPDKTPSFFLYPNNTFKCFGCQAQGDAIDFLMARDHLDFRSAVKLLF